MRFNIISFCILLFAACDNFGEDKIFQMPESKRYQFDIGDILTYQSDSSTEKFEVVQIVNGQYSDSQSGTCGKPRLFIYEYQAVYLKPTDSLNRSYYFVSAKTDDCAHYPSLYEKRIVQSINGSYNGDNSDRIAWLDEFDDQIVKFQSQHDKWSVRNQIFNNVYEYKVENGKRIAKLYYTRSFGFVGYELKNGTLFVLNK